MLLAETHIHLVQVSRENGSLITACGSANLDDDVLVVRGVRRDEHELDVFFERGKLRLGRRDGLLGEFLHVGIVEHLLCIGDVVARLHILASLFDKRTLIGVFLGKARVFLLIGQDRRIAKLGLELFVTLDDFFEFVAHGYSLFSSKHARADMSRKAVRRP